MNLNVAPGTPQDKRIEPHACIMEQLHEKLEQAAMARLNNGKVTSELTDAQSGRVEDYVEGIGEEDSPAGTRGTRVGRSRNRPDCVD